MKYSIFKKAESEMFWIIILALVAIIAGIIIIMLSKGGFEKAFGGVDAQLDNLGDYDKDGVSNMFDKCPCTHLGNEAEPGLSGCTLGTTTEGAETDQSNFKNKACP